MKLINKKYSPKGKIKTYFLGIKIKTKKFKYNENCIPKPDNKHLKLSVVIPVYNAFQDLKKLVSSIEKSKLSKDTEIIFLDDCSTDTNVYGYLKDICDKNEYILLRNSNNQGFIKTCNKGIKHSKGDIVVLLNSDTMIPSNFEEKVLQCFKSDKNIAFASPIGSHTGWWNIPCNDYNFEKIAQIVSSSSANKYPAFTPEGFCFCCRKKVLKKIGLLDEIYGKGYCEEDDLVMRAIIAGYRTVLIDNLYVYHKSHASFSSEGRMLLYNNNLKIFGKKYGNLQGIIRSKMNIKNYIKEISNNIFYEMNTKLRIYYTYNILDYKNKIESWYKKMTQKDIDLSNPQTFNEKIQWLKLYDSTPIKTQLTDKYLVRDWIKEKIGSEYLIPLLGVYDNFDEINFDELPNKFIIKCNHGSGYNIIVRNKNNLDKQDAKQKINK